MRIRPGSDLAFTGALIRLVIEEQLFDRAFVERATNALFKVDARYQFKDGIFSGFDASGATYDPASWSYPARPTAGRCA
ncbi:MAG: hypothetical protein U1E76_15500 [Planctomycetota bacterium]